MKSKILILFTLLVSNFGFGQYQQYINMVTPYLNDSIRSGFFYFTTPNNFQPGNLYQLYRQNAPDLNNNMVLTDSHIDSLVGFTHYKYQQTYMNIPIEGAGCIEHFDTNGSLSFINAKVADSIKKSHKPALSKEEALKFLFEQIKGKEKVVFAWESEEWEDQIKFDTDNGNATWYPEPELIWAIDNYKHLDLIISGDRFTLAYKIEIKFISPKSETIVYYIDAQTGSILKKRSRSIGITADVYGYGPQWMDAQWRGGFIQKYELNSNNPLRNVHTKKFDNYNTSWSNMPETRKSSNYWGSTYLTETSAHFHVLNSWNYFRNYFGRNGFDNNGTVIRVITQLPEINAYYNNDLNIPGELLFGKSSTNYDLSFEPSIVGHEFTHGVIHHTSGLEYEDEPGALNESFSDIFGTVIQSLTLDNTYTDWIIGNHIPNTLTSQRSLADPNSMGVHWSGNYDSNGKPIYNLGQPEKYNGNLWCYCPSSVDYGGVHINSGVQNKWFQVLTDGNYAVNPIGMNKAAKISYLALTSHLMSSAQYNDSKEATITAAIQLYGECSEEHKSTVAAWKYVGLNAYINCNTNSISNFNIDDISVYPNPTTSIVTIELPRTLSEPILIYDISGKLVKTVDEKGVYFKADLSNLEQGVYLMHFTFEEKQIVKRIIVQ